VVDSKNMQLILDSCHAVAINLNDTFYYACADSACIDMDELGDLDPVLTKYGFDAFVAYEAIKRGHDPQIPSHASDPGFIGAKAMIQEMMDKADTYGEFFTLREAIKEKPLAPAERKKVAKQQSRLLEWFSFFIGR